MKSRRRFIYHSSLGAMALIAKPQMFLDFSKQLPEGFTEIRNGVGYFEGRGGTMGYMFDGQSSVAIDSQFPKQAKSFIEGIIHMGGQTINTLINTHHHRDHTSGNPEFVHVTDQIIAHDQSRINQENAAKEYGIEAEQVYPNETFSKQWTKRFNKETIVASYYGPAHTNGDIIVHFENANVAHMGDLVFNRKFPYIDKGAGANIENWIQVLDNALDYFDADTQFIFGHANEGYSVLGNKDDILAFQDYLSMLLKYMEIQLRAGKDLEKILKDTKIIPGATQWKGEGVERSINAAFQEMNS